MNRRFAMPLCVAVGMLLVGVSLAHADSPAASLTATSALATTDEGMQTSAWPDFGLLAHPSIAFDAHDLWCAQRDGYTIREIAEMINISRLSEWDFQQILLRVQGGTTFATLADENGLAYCDIIPTDAQIEWVKAYLLMESFLGESGFAAYEALDWGYGHFDESVAAFKAQYAIFIAAKNAIPPADTLVRASVTEQVEAAPAPPPAPAPAPAPMAVAPPPAPAPAPMAAAAPVVEKRVVVKRVVRHRRHRRVHHYFAGWNHGS